MFRGFNQERKKYILEILDLPLDQVINPPKLSKEKNNGFGYEVKQCCMMAQ